MFVGDSSHLNTASFVKENFGETNERRPRRTKRVVDRRSAATITNPAIRRPRLNVSDLCAWEVHRNPSKFCVKPSKKYTFFGKNTCKDFPSEVNCAKCETYLCSEKENMKFAQFPSLKKLVTLTDSSPPEKSQGLLSIPKASLPDLNLELESKLPLEEDDDWDLVSESKQSILALACGEEWEIVGKDERSSIKPLVCSNVGMNGDRSSDNVLNVTWACVVASAPKKTSPCVTPKRSSATTKILTMKYAKVESWEEPTFFDRFQGERDYLQRTRRTRQSAAHRAKRMLAKEATRAPPLP